MVVYCGGILRYYRSVQVVGFFDVAARLCKGDGPIAVEALYHNTVHLMTTKIISQYRLLTSTGERKYDGAVQ